jgi:3-hydroxy-3-methylglutaryl CoA synthase/uncharacterized OB-fold protein
MRGILSWGAYVPYRRLDRATIAAVAGSGGGRGTRAVASYDEDTTTLAVEAARVALRAAPAGCAPGALWFSTVAPAYLDKTNATTVHAALRLDASAPAYDALGAVRSATASLRAALDGRVPTLVATADIRTGLPGGPDEAAGGDAGAALLVGGPDDGPVLAELVGTASMTEEFLDRWRAPGDDRSKLWEERFGEGHYLALVEEVYPAALKSAGIASDAVDAVTVSGTHDRAITAAVKRIGIAPDRVAGDHRAVIGNTGAAQPALGLVSALEHAQPGQVIAQIVLADGADVFVWRTTPALAAHAPARPVDEQIANGGPITYGKYLAWRGWLPVEPPRRPEPIRPSASAAARSADWKFGFVGSQRADGSVHLPPSPLDTVARPMADEIGVIRTFTIDRIAYSPSPPIVFAVVDFESGGRLPVELTDVDAADVVVGGTVEMTFRRLFTADGVHNYFWKARPRR